MSNSSTVSALASAAVGYVEPSTVNILSATFMSMMLFMIFSPMEFMRGGTFQKEWFKDLPNDRRHRLYFEGTFMAIICLCGGVVPAILAPDSRMLTLQCAVVNGVNLVHGLTFLLTPLYADVRPGETDSLAQWWFMNLMSVVFVVLGGLATVGAEQATEPYALTQHGTYISTRTANIIGLAFSSTFGLAFSCIPRFLLSTFWSDEHTDSTEYKLGFPQLQNVYQGEYMWVRNAGITILGLNVGALFATDGLSTGLDSPLYTVQTLLICAVLGIFNLNQLGMAPYGKKSWRNVWMGWVPTLVLSAGMVTVGALSLF